MNAKKILEGLFGLGTADLMDGSLFVTDEPPKEGRHIVHNPGWSHDDDQLNERIEHELIKRYGSVQKAAEAAAKWLNSPCDRGCAFYQFIEGEWWDTTGYAPAFISDLDLIAEAVEAGWEG